MAALGGAEKKAAEVFGTVGGPTAPARAVTTTGAPGGDVTRSRRGVQGVAS